MKIEKVIFWSLNFLSLLIIFQVGLAIIPKFPSCFSNAFTINLNQVILNLSYSYAAGVIMYFLISYIPELHKKRQIDATIKPDLVLLIKEIHIFIFYINSKYLNVEGINNIQSNDFRKMNKFSNDKMNFRYKFSSKPNRIESTGDVTELEYFIVRRDAIIELINDIFIIPSAVYLKDDLIVCLRNLKNCSLFKFAEYKGFMDVENFNNQMFEFYNLYKELLKLTEIQPDNIEGH